MKPSVLLTGATGYVGGRLLGRFEAEQYPVRCVVRRPEFLRGRVGSGIEVVPGDLLDRESLERAMEGIHTAYYLVHSMGTSHGFEETDRQAAENFAAAARAQGIQRIIYLGGVGSRLACQAYGWGWLLLCMPASAVQREIWRDNCEGLEFIGSVGIVRCNLPCSRRLGRNLYCRFST